jgi:uncharacterized protein
MYPRAPTKHADAVRRGTEPRARIVQALRLRRGRVGNGGVPRTPGWVNDPAHRIATERYETVMATSKRGPEPGSQKAKHGGQAVREKYGPEFYSRIGKKGGEAVKEKRGPAFYAEIGKKGGESTKRQQGPEFYSRIGKKGGERGRTAPRQTTSSNQNQ